MAEKSGIQYDSDAVFISYSPEDIDWAEDELRPRLEKSGVKVITGEDLTGGATVSLNRERAIADTRRTIVVLSPEWVANSWNGFEADMLVHLDPAAIKRKLLPVLLRKSEIPPRIARLTIRDLTDKKRYDSRLAQLIRDVEDAVPPPPRESFPNPWEWYWRQARRRGVTSGRLVAAGILLLTVFLLVFTQWSGWEQLPPLPNRDPLGRLYTVDNLIFIASVTETGADSGLWRSENGGDSWQSVGGFLDLDDQRATVRDFAATSTAIYAATRGRGLWRSDRKGQDWSQVGTDQLPIQLHRISVSGDGRLLLVSAIVEGVYLSIDAGERWERVDGRQSCPSDKSRNLPTPITEATVLVNGDVFLAGAGGSTRVHSGLYESTDGGRCWDMVHGQAKRGPAPLGNEYRALAALPKAGDVLVLYKDHDAEQGDARTSLHTLRGSEPLWPSNISDMARLVVVSGDSDRWFVAAIDGVIVSDTLPQSSTGANRFPSLRSCLLVLCQPVDFALDADGHTPLLLTWHKLYRWGRVPGYRLLWP